MRHMFLLSSLALALSAATAHAQIFSIYATSSNTRFSNVETGEAYNPTSPTYTEQYTNFWTSGIGGGITLNFLPLGPVRVGLDVRGSTRRGTPGSDTGLVGFRVGAKVPFVHIKPYLQASGGYVDTRTVNVSSYPPAGSTQAGGTFNTQYAAYEVFGGIDIPLVHFVDFRAIEIGGGQGYTVGGDAPLRQKISLFSVNSGIVLHF